MERLVLEMGVIGVLPSSYNAVMRKPTDGTINPEIQIQNRYLEWALKIARASVVQKNIEYRRGPALVAFWEISCETLKLY